MEDLTAMTPEQNNARRRGAARNIGEQAVEWLLVLEEATPETRQRFGDWLLESPLHVQAFLRASTMDALLERADPRRALAIDVHAATCGDTPDIVPPEQPAANAISRKHSPRKHRALMVAALAALAVAAALLWRPPDFAAWLPETLPAQYRTTVGEQRTIELPDGSVLHMNTGSAVQVRFTAGERHVRLLEGEAMFRVQPDPTRPFRVYSGYSIIQALGTVFNVERRHGSALVSVLEGAVQIDHDPAFTPHKNAAHPLASPSPPVRLDAGEQVRVARDGTINTPAPANLDQISAWRQRRLIFVDEPLHTIAEAFNRYNRTPKIRIGDEQARQRRYAAAFDADDPQSLLTVLEKDPTLQVVIGTDDLLIRSR